MGYPNPGKKNCSLYAISTEVNKHYFCATECNIEPQSSFLDVHCFFLGLKDDSRAKAVKICTDITTNLQTKSQSTRHQAYSSSLTGMNEDAITQVRNKGPDL